MSTMSMTKCFLLLVVCAKICDCVHLYIKKTVTFDIPNPEPAGENIIFATLGIDEGGPRNLNSLCPSDRCSLSITDEKLDNKANKISAVVNLRWHWGGELWMYGDLKVCRGPKNIFREFPTKTKWNCRKLTKSKVKPALRGMDPLSISIYTWFMDLDNYNELRLRGSTDIVLPLLPKSYKLPVYVMIFKQSKAQCTLQRPYAAKPVSLEGNGKKYTKELTRVTFHINSAPEKSGTYTVSCLGKYYHPTDLVWHHIRTEKDITLRFEKVPHIELIGVTGNTVVIPYSNETAEFYVNIYSTSDIETIHITRSDDVKSKVSSEILLELISHPYYSLLAKYRVTLPWTDDSVTGPYTITVRNKKRESATLPVQFHKVKELVVLVSPITLSLEEGSPAIFQCVVLTDMPTNTIVTWEYGLEGSIEAERLSLTGNRKALQLTLQSPTPPQSGLYTCVADNGFQKVQKTVSLSVFPPGANMNKPQPKATWMQRMSSDNIVEVDTFTSLKKAAKVVGILAIVALAIVATAVGGPVGWRLYHKLQLRKQAGKLREVCWKLYLWLQQRIKSVLAREKTHSDVDAETESLLKSIKKEKKSRKVTRQDSDTGSSEDEKQHTKKKDKKNTTSAKKAQTQGKKVKKSEPSSSVAGNDNQSKKKQNVSRTPTKANKKKKK